MADTLAKSLADLDALADELLMKSQAAEEKEKDDEKLAPEEISDDSAEGDADEEKDDAEAKPEEKNDEPVEDEEPVKKSENSEPVEDEEEPEELEDDDSEEDDTQEDVAKSLKDDFESDDTIAKGMEASEFLGAVVEVLSKALGDVQYDVMSGSKNQAAANDVLAKSLQASLAMNASLREDNAKLVRRINKIEKSMVQGFDKIMDSLDDISSQPVGLRKSVASVSVHDRNFGASMNGAPQPRGFETLQKSQVMGVLENEMVSGNPMVSASDIIGYESGAPLRQDLQQLVVSKLR